MWYFHLDRKRNTETAEQELVGLGRIESFKVLNAVINLSSSKEQSCKFLCLARPFCCIYDGETCKIGISKDFGSTSTPCFSSSSHFACCLLWCKDFSRRRATTEGKICKEATTRVVVPTGEVIVKDFRELPIDLMKIFELVLGKGCFINFYKF